MTRQLGGIKQGEEAGKIRLKGETVATRRDRQVF